MKTSHLGIAALLAIGGATFGVAAPALAAPGDPVPSCVASQVSTTATTTRVSLRNGCVQTQRVGVLLSGHPQITCTVLTPGAVKTLLFTFAATVTLEGC